jgi:hypothetical protein
LLPADLAAERPAGKWRKRVADCGLSEAVLGLLESCWDDDPGERPRDALALAEGLAAVRAAPQTPAVQTPVQRAVVAGPTADPVTHYAQKIGDVSEVPLTSSLKMKFAWVPPGPSAVLSNLGPGVSVSPPA